MAKTSLYLPDDLAEQVRAYGISISEVAQHALRRAVQEAQIKEKDMTDVHALAERLNLQRQKDTEAARAAAAVKAAKARDFGTHWAQTMATAEEIELVATYDGPDRDFRMPTSLIAVTAGPGNPMGPNYPNWADLQAAVREIWEQIKPLLIEIDKYGRTLPVGSGGFTERINPAYRLWERREPGFGASKAEWDAYKAEEPDEFL